MEPLLHLYETLGIQVATNVPTLQSVDYDKDGTVDRSDTWAYTEQGRNTGYQQDNDNDGNTEKL